ncbi:MAG: hypothetical protein IKR81_13460 [Victivallales bacterium]|nr:hypothetical protein [Victivallales bacterium]
MPLEITESNGLWSATHAKGRCGGPRKVAIKDDLVTDFCCSIDSVPDYLVHSKNAHVYHKAGQSVFEGEGSYPSGQTIRQISRYAANSMRVTWDINWPKATAPKDSVQIGNATLNGKWPRMMALERDGKAAWQKLAPGQVLTWQEAPPLALVFEREDGAQVEFSYGFDLWRWDFGLGLTNSIPLKVTVAEETIQILRQVSDLSVAPSDKEEAPTPQARDYRFMATLAWATPDMDQYTLRAKQQGATVPVQFDDNGLLLNGLPEGATCLAIDLAAMSETCMESDALLSKMKRFIRQLASFSAEGSGVFSGFSPTCCMEASHCEKRKATLHWDHRALLSFAAWAKNCLGEGWSLDFHFPAPLAELPSLKYISLPNGFIYNE